jgi:osmotically inducible lipoprotein OsmB
MRKSIILLSLATLSLAGCIQGDGERALVGAGVGAVASKAFGGSTEDAILAGVGGAAVGALCDDAGVCR